METIRSLAPVTGQPRVHERNAGNRGNAEAFRRSLQEQSGQAPDDRPAARSQVPEPVARIPLRPALQPHAGGGRKDAGAIARHVDVLA
jgi:hypothetical protein